MNFLRRGWSAVAPAGGVGYHRRHMATSRPAPRQPVRRPTSGKLRAILQDVGTPPPAPLVPAPFQEAALAALRSGDVLGAAPARSGKTWIREQAGTGMPAGGGGGGWPPRIKAPADRTVQPVA